ALYEQLLPLAAQGWFGDEPRRPELARAFTRLLCGFPDLLAQEPQLFAGAALDALHNLTDADAGLAEAWCDRLLSVKQHLADLPTWLEAGRVAAWRVGLAAQRAAALNACAHLEPALAAALLDAHAPLDRVEMDALRTAPWRSPGHVTAPELRIAGKLGGFRGLGGPFVRPPTVHAHDGRLFATDGRKTWQVFADAFGAMLVEAPGIEATNVPGRADALKADGTVTLAGLTRTFPELREATSWAALDTTLIAAFDTSHCVTVVACTAP
ncbi:MAG TPA: hypothetical protein V6D47_20725, partial [Oscillatoriaceae cyanobacterium]